MEHTKIPTCIFCGSALSITAYQVVGTYQAYTFCENCEAKGPIAYAKNKTQATVLAIAQYRDLFVAPDLLAACVAQQKAIEDIIEAWTNYDMLAALDHYLYDDAQSLAIEAIAKAKGKGDQCSV